MLFFNDTATTEIYTLSLHDALPIYPPGQPRAPLHAVWQARLLLPGLASQLHGPYYQWTRKVRGKTVTVRLTREEARLVEGWISNGRQLDKIVAQVGTISLRITERVVKQLRKS